MSKFGDYVKRLRRDSRDLKAILEARAISEDAALKTIKQVQILRKRDGRHE